MKAERKQFHIQRLMELAEENGTQSQVDDMSYMLGQISRFEGELRDIKSGIRDQKRHPHHPVPSLRLSVRDGWRCIRQLENDIKNKNL